MERIKKDPLWWLRNATRTFNPQWQEQGFDSPYAPFPEDEYLDYLFDYLRPTADMRYEWVKSQVPPDPARGARLRPVVKSRTMMGSWGCVGYFTHQAMTVPGREYLFQSQTQEKAEELISYAKTLWNQQEQWLKDKFPMDRRLDDFPKDMVRWENGSRIIGIPSDPEKVRSYHPTGMLIDEASFISEFRKNLMTALPACNVIVPLSSAGPSEYGDWVGA